MFGILPEPFENPKEGKEAIVSGWGITVRLNNYVYVRISTVLIIKFLSGNKKRRKLYQTIQRTTKLYKETVGNH